MAPGERLGRCDSAVSSSAAADDVVLRAGKRSGALELLREDGLLLQ